MQKLNIELELELWPSLEEIDQSKSENLYLGRLTEYYDSIYDLYNQLDSNTIRYTKRRDDRNENKGFLGSDFGGFNQPVARLAPPDFVEILAFLSSTGIAISVYKILKLWVKFKNGRKIKIKMYDFEIETSQMNKKEFMKLIEAMNKNMEDYFNSEDKTDLKESNSTIQKKKLRKYLKKEGYILIDRESIERFEEKRQLKNRINKKK